MADQITPRDSPATNTKSNTSEDSIINRKIERRGLPSSFSSNLVNPRASPPRSKDAKVASSGKSVKSIVSFFESSKSNPSCATYEDGDSVKSKLKSTSASHVSSSTATSESQLPPIQKQHLIHAPDVEDYSLTLLKYRQYFTEKPLARCLDGQCQKTETSWDHTSAENPKKDSIKEPSAEEEQQLNGTKKRQTLARDDATEKALDGKGPDLNAKEAPDPQPLLRRDRRVAAAYWNHVRDYLWISDRELEDGKHRGSGDSLMPKSFFFDPVPASPTMSVPSPDFPGSRCVNDRRANSDASQRSQRSLEKQRHHLAVTQAQLDDLDEYIHKMQVDQEVFTTSPTSTAPSPFASPTLETYGAAARGSSFDIPRGQRCECCSKFRKNPGPDVYRGSGHSQSRPPQRPAMKLSRGISGQIHAPPILGEEDYDRNFF